MSDTTEQTEDTSAAPDAAPTEDAPRRFDAKRHIIKVQGGRDYLPVSARLVWFRMERPDWGIVTQAEVIELAPAPELRRPPYAIFRTTIFDATGRVIATATKYEDAKGFPDFIEKCETGSVGRALAMCGYGTQFAPELEEGDRLADGPVGQGDGTAAYGQQNRGGNARPAGQQNRQAPPQGGNGGGNRGPAQNAAQGSRPERQPMPAPGTSGEVTPEEKQARDEAYERFANAAHDAGYDVCVMQNGESVFSYMKIGALIVRATACPRPGEYRGWRPPVALLEAAIQRLPELRGNAQEAPQNAGNGNGGRTAGNNARAAQGANRGGQNRGGTATAPPPADDYDDDPSLTDPFA